MHHFSSQKKKGYSLLEMMVYISILAVFSIIIIDTIISFTKTYHTLLTLRIVDRTGIDAMERLTRDIRGASQVDAVNSTLGSSPGILTLITTANSVSTTTKYYIQNNTMKLDVNGVYMGPLSSANSSVTNLVFTKLDNGVSTAVKIDMTVQGSVGSTIKTKNYRATVVLRGF